MNTGLLRTKSALFAGAAVLLSLAAAPALAQGGSYARSCTNIQAYGGQVTAECRREDGSWSRTTLDASRCAGGIANTDGRLTCNNGRTVGSGGGGYGGWQGHGYRRDYDRNYGYDRWQGYGSSGYQPYGGYYGR